MQTIELKFRDEDYEGKLMPHLRDQVFHVTTEKAFKNIIKDSYIHHNQSGQFPLNTSSDKSFGRNNGWVCLFDFRMKSESEIEKTKSCYYFLGPTWFWEYFKKHSKLNIVYLILNSTCHDRIIPNSAARGNCGQYVPITECWFPGNVPVEYIEKVVMLKVYESAPVHNQYAYALHLIEYEDRKIIRRNSSRKETAVVEGKE